MSRYNLLDEPWISVISDSEGQMEVSISELLRHAGQYRSFAGDTAPQDFAVMRLILAILQTVFSRYDADGHALVPVDGQMCQTAEINDDEDDREDYTDARIGTWRSIWDRKSFPEILFTYLEQWKDHFYLFDDRYPFYQVTEGELLRELPQGKKPTMVQGRFLNRTISESGNKQALFSPRAEGKDDTNKDILTNAELTRWLITFQGYTGVSDKCNLNSKEQKPSNGWLFDLGGIFPEGSNLFETLMLNYIPVHPDEQYQFGIEEPCWELSGREVMERRMKELPVTSLSELYTNWSRAICLDPEMELPGQVEIRIAKLPAIEHRNAFLEPMTLWRYNEAGDNKGQFTPKKHVPEQALWRSFGLITLRSSEEKKQQKPGILSQIQQVSGQYGNRVVRIRAVSMQEDDNASSRVPVDEITDSLQLNDLVLSDETDQGWIVRINESVNETKDIIDRIYRSFLLDIAVIRGLNPEQPAQRNRINRFLGREIGELYQEVDVPFRNWLIRIQPDDSREAKLLEWKSELQKVVLRRAEELTLQTSDRDMTGIEKDGRVMNIATAYLSFRRKMYTFFH